MKRRCRILYSSIVGVLLISALVGCAGPGSNTGSSVSTSSSQSSSESAGSSAQNSTANMTTSVSDSKGSSSKSEGSHVNPGGSSGHYFDIGETGSSDLNRWNLNYMKLNGHITRGFRFTDDSDGKCILQVDVTTKSGELDITVMDSEGNVLDTYKNIATSTFDIDLGSGGDYQIRVDARNHDGGFTIKQKTPDA